MHSIVSEESGAMRLLEGTLVFLFDRKLLKQVDALISTITLWSLLFSIKVHVNVL